MSLVRVSQKRHGPFEKRALGAGSSAEAWRTNAAASEASVSSCSPLSPTPSWERLRKWPAGSSLRRAPSGANLETKLDYPKSKSQRGVPGPPAVPSKPACHCESRVGHLRVIRNSIVKSKFFFKFEYRASGDGRLCHAERIFALY